MRILVTFEQIASERDDVLGTPEVWETFGRAWCEAKTQPGGETLAGAQQQATNQITLRTPWTPALAQLTANMRAVLPDGRQLGIQSATNEDLANRALVIMCVVRE